VVEDQGRVRRRQRRHFLSAGGESGRARRFGDGEAQWRLCFGFGCDATWAELCSEFRVRGDVVHVFSTFLKPKHSKI
jgi:hypothetical protein